MLVYLGMGIGIFFSEQMKGKDGWMALGVGSGVYNKPFFLWSTGLNIAEMVIPL